MELKAALRLGECPHLALTGSGGKSTALFQLSRQVRSPLILSATTHLARHQTRLADRHVVIHTEADLNQLESLPWKGRILVTGDFDGERTRGLGEAAMEWLGQFCGYHSLPLLVEADGSRQRPLKAPAAYEPVVPPFVDAVVVVAGLAALGKPLTSRWVHRSERFAALSGMQPGRPIGVEALAAVLTHPKGGLKGIPSAARRIALLNQADTPELQALGGELAGSLLDAYHAVLVASLKQETVFARYEPVAGVVLAAGRSERFGRQPKQLLLWRGRPLVWHVAHTAWRAGLSPVVVVGGEHTPQLRLALADLPVQLIHNPEWARGQSTSVQRGLKAVPKGSGAAMFFLADQPQIPVPLVCQLVEAHARSGSAIVAPLVDGERGHPVLFDRETFGEFAALSGDEGARRLFQRYAVEWVRWHDPTALLDVDTPQDYQRLLALE